MFEYDQRVRGKRAKLPSAKRISLSGGGGDPTIQPMRTGSLSIASSIAIGVAGRVAFVALWHRSADSILQDVHGVPRRYDP